MQEILLIGGHSDGKWIKVPELLSAIRVPHIDNSDAVFGWAPQRTIYFEIYRLERFGDGEGNLYPYYLLGGLNGGNAIEMLLANYQKCMHAAEIS